MEHRNIRLLGLGSLIAAVIVGALYDCYTVEMKDLSLRMGLKVTPILIYMFFIMVYIVTYRVTIYACFTLASLFLCMFGDIFIALYDPSLAESRDNKMLYFIVGGTFFFLARIILMLTFMIKPYTKISIITHYRSRMILCHVLFSLPFLILAILNLIRETSFPSICASLYLATVCGLPLSYSFLRIGALQNAEITESTISSSLAFIGIILFNMADILLIICLYTTYFPAYCLLISINIYWVALYLITLSVVRAPKESYERGLFLLPLMEDDF